MGGAIAVLSAQVDDMTRALEKARGAANGSAERLEALTARGEAVARGWNFCWPRCMTCPSRGRADAERRRGRAPSRFVRRRARATRWRPQNEQTAPQRRPGQPGDSRADPRGVGSDRGWGRASAQAIAEAAEAVPIRADGLPAASGRAGRGAGAAAKRGSRRRRRRWRTGLPRWRLPMQAIDHAAGGTGRGRGEPESDPRHGRWRGRGRSSRLTAVYETMKPKRCGSAVRDHGTGICGRFPGPHAARCGRCHPGGHVGREAPMRVSVLLAGRNAAAPKE